jgi:hypothetical protein
VDFLNALVHVPEWHGCDGDETIKVLATPVDEEIIVGANTFEHEFRLA